MQSQIVSAQPVKIAARPRWVDTAIHLQAGVSYVLRASGRWRDCRIGSGPEGYASANLIQRFTDKRRRVPTAPWFALIGALDRRPDTQFVIGTGCAYRSPMDGQLTCFANDLRGFYFNNSGSVELTVVEATSAGDLLERR